MKILPRRLALVTVETKRFGVSRAIASATALVKALASGQAALGTSGTTTCSPLPPEVFAKPLRPLSVNRWRTSPAASIRSSQVTPVAGIEIEDQRVGRFDPIDRRAPGMDLQRRGLGQGDEPVEILDRQQGPRPSDRRDRARP
jgi:hypothetical protein